MAQNVGALNADTNAIFEALRAKGVDVPADAQLSDVADMIESIVIPHQNEVEIGERWYPYVQIGEQLWTAKNLREPIGTSGTDYTYYSQESLDYYGMYYTWNILCSSSEVMRPQLSSLLPAGWRLPTKSDFQKLFDYLGGINVSGKKLKGNSGLWNVNTGTDDYGFNALPAGCNIGRWDNIGNYAHFNTSTQGNTSSYSVQVYLGGSVDRAEFGHENSKAYKLPIRLVKDAT